MDALELMRLFEIGISGVIHVGANDGSECVSYNAAGADACLYIEPVTETFDRLRSNISRFPRHLAVKAVCSDVSGETVTMNVSSNSGLSSSIFPLGNHATIFPDITYIGQEVLVTRTLDEIVAAEAPDADFNLLVVDTQGAELKVLKGATQVLSQIDGVYIEVSEMPLYVGGCTLDEVTAFLRAHGFDMKWLQIWPKLGSGDAFFVVRSRPLPPTPSVNIALNRPARQSSLSIWSVSADDAQGGNNGARTGRYGFHTDIELNPWWMVDLGGSRAIQEIRVFNRLDVAAERASSLRILISDDQERWKLIHDQGGRIFGGIDGRPLRIKPKSVAARYVRLQLCATEQLHLDEVEVY